MTDRDTASGGALSLDARLRLIEPLCAIARAAGAAIMPFFRQEVAVRRKADDSPVTEADEAAEAIILPALRRLMPDVPAVAEEATARGRTADIGDGPFWLVDPLDGTKEFLAHRDEFTVNIGLIEGGRPVLGVVLAPARDVLFAAAGPGTAFRETAGRRTPIAARAQPADGAVVVHSRSHDDPHRIAALLGGTPIKSTLVTGSSIKFCLVATGEADIYPRYGPTSEWDTAAGHAILAAAGGSVRTPEGRELAYGKPDFRNGPFIARGRDQR